MIDRQHCPLVTREQPWDGAGKPPCRSVAVGPVRIGGAEPVLIAGPCAVSSRTTLLELAKAAKAAGATLLRGGAFKGRTHPYSFQGLGAEGLEYLAEARAATGLPFVTEVLDPRQVEGVAQVADMLQVGCRSMQNFPLLQELGRQPRPVLLKRGFSATLAEWLCAAEYIAREGNEQIVLCERGIRTFASFEYSRNTVDINAVYAVLESSHLPLLLDPSHGTGRAAMVPSVGRAALAAGVHGLLLELRLPETPLAEIPSDAEQSIFPDALRRLADFARLCAQQL